MKIGAFFILRIFLINHRMRGDLAFRNAKTGAVM